MSVSKRDDLHHTYGDYLVWSRTYGDELLDGSAYVREPPAHSYLHQKIIVDLAHQPQTSYRLGFPARKRLL
jgi:hypothetical protein